jgi:PAS domain S-box-containing protein
MEGPIQSNIQIKSIGFRYGFAVFSALAGLLLRESFTPILGPDNPYHAAWAAVALTAWYCGFGPTILTSFLSWLGIWYWFLAPYHTFDLNEPRTQIPGMIGFLFFSGFIAALGEANLRSKAKLEWEIAERKLANEKLSEKEEEYFAASERFRALMRELPVGVSFSDDATCQNISGNPTAFAQFDVDPEDNLSASAPDSNAPGRQLRFIRNGREVSPSELPLQRAVNENRTIAPMEFEVHMPSGRRWIVEASGAPVHNSQGEVVGGVAVHSDITERKRAEEALRVSEERYRLVTETMLYGVIHQDAEGRVTAMNPAAARITGFELEELVGATPLNLEKYTVREDGSRFPGLEHPQMVALRTCKPVFGVVMGVDNPKTKERRWIKIDAVPTCLPGESEAFEVYSVFEDITERKRAEAALRESEALFRAFFEQAAVGIAGISVEGRYVFANQRFCDLLRRPLDEVLQMTTAQATHPDFEAVDAENLRKLQDGHALQCTTEKLYVRSDGSHVWATTTVFPLHNEDGTIKAFAKVIEDITVRKNVEQELARERCALESRVEERTRQLNKTIKFLNIQAAQRERAEVSIRTLSARLLQLQDEERRRIARELHDSAGQILAALDMQLSIVQTKTQYLESDLTSVVSDSVSLVQEASRSIRTMSYLLHPPLLDETGLASTLRWFVEGFAQRSGIEVELKISRQFDRLPREMELTIFRLVQEALTNVHRHSGSPTAQVELDRTEAEVTLLIRDQGKGIPESTLNQSDQEANKIGVGIRGMHERVRQLGGTMEFLSGVPGTTLQVRLPLKSKRRDEIASPTSHSEAAS